MTESTEVDAQPEAELEQADEPTVDVTDETVDLADAG